MRCNNLEAGRPQTKNLSRLTFHEEGRAPSRSAGMERSKNTTAPDFKSLPDKNLVRCFVDTRDERAFNEIVDRYADKIYRTALRITRSPSAAEDVLQEVFIILVEKLHTFRSEYKFSTWLY
ncbi:MAG: RNA polymerase sigma factor, partial [Candidatus Dadabacteria bacterium]